MPDYSAIEEFRTLPQTLADAGYVTGLVGKYHLGAHEKPQLGFSFWATFSGGHTESFVNQVVVDNGRTFNVADTGEHLTDFWTRRAVDFIQAQSKKRPFFLMLSYNGPYVLPPTVLDPPNTRHAAWYEAHPPRPILQPGEPVHPYLEAFAKIFPGQHPAARGQRRQGRHRVADEPAGDDQRRLGSDDGGRRRGPRAGGARQGRPGEEHAGRLHVGPGLGLRPARPVGQQLLGLALPGLQRQHPDPADRPAAGEDRRRRAQRSHGQRVRPAADAARLPRPRRPGHRQLARARATRRSCAAARRAPSSRCSGSTSRRASSRPASGSTSSASSTRRTSSTTSRRIPGETRNLAADPARAAVVADLDGQLTAFFERYADPQWDVWRGGTAKATLVYGNRNRRFAEHFPNWTPPVTRKAVPFRDSPRHAVNRRPAPAGLRSAALRSGRRGAGCRAKSRPPSLASSKHLGLATLSLLRSPSMPPEPSPRQPERSAPEFCEFAAACRSTRAEPVCAEAGDGSPPGGCEEQAEQDAERSDDPSERRARMPEASVPTGGGAGIGFCADRHSGASGGVLAGAGRKKGRIAAALP